MSESFPFEFDEKHFTSMQNIASNVNMIEKDTCYLVVKLLLLFSRENGNSLALFKIL